MGIIKETREFALQGNVVDIAAGFVIGGAFLRLVTSLVRDIINPLVGMTTGGTDLDRYGTLLRSDGESMIYLSWGSFLSNFLQVTIVALVLLLVIRAVSRARKRYDAEDAARSAAPSREVQLLADIRDLLRG